MGYRDDITAPHPSRLEFERSADEQWKKAELLAKAIPASNLTLADIIELIQVFGLHRSSDPFSNREREAKLIQRLAAKSKIPA